MTISRSLGSTLTLPRLRRSGTTSHFLGRSIRSSCGCCRRTRPSDLIRPVTLSPRSTQLTFLRSASLTINRTNRRQAHSTLWRVVCSSVGTRRWTSSRQSWRALYRAEAGWSLSLANRESARPAYRSNSKPTQVFGTHRCSGASATRAEVHLPTGRGYRRSARTFQHANQTNSGARWVQPPQLFLKSFPM